MQKIVIILGVVFAIWMPFGTVAFGLASTLNWWYSPIGVVYLALSIYLAHRMSIARAKGYRLGRSFWVVLFLSWFCSLAFGILVPGKIDDTLMSIVGLWFGESSMFLSIAMCNPAGIVSLALLAGAVVLAVVRSQDPRPEEDEGMDEVKMVRHPLA